MAGFRIRIKRRIDTISAEARSGIVYTAATVFSRGLAIITIPIFTRIMTTDQIGVVNLYGTWHGLISVVATLSLTSGGFAVAMKEYESKRNEYVSSIQSLTTIVALSFLIAYMAFPVFWNKLLGLPQPLMIVLLIGLFVEPARDFWMAKQRYEYKYKLSGALSIISALIATVVSLIVVLNLKKVGSDNLAEGRLVSNNIVLLGVAAVIWIYQFFKGKTFFNKEFWRFSLSLSIPLVGYQVAAQILNASDRIMIDKIVGKSAVGIYGTLYSVSSISLLVWNTINASFVPYLFRNIEKKEQKIKEISFSLLVLYAFVAIILTFLAPEIVRILAPEEYYEAIYIMPPISAGIFFTSVSHMYSNILVYHKKTKYVMYGSLIAAMLNIILNAVFIPIYGYKAAAYTTLLGYVVMALLEAIWANKLHKQIIYNDLKVYDDFKITILSVFTTVMILSGLIWYRNSIIRYTITIVISIITIKFFNYILNCTKNENMDS